MEETVNSALASAGFADTDQLITFLTEQGATFGLKLIAAGMIFLIGRWLAGIITRTARTALKRIGLEDTLERFLGNIIHFVLLVVVIIATVGALGIETTSLLAVLGAAGLAVGLALQGSLSNFAAGVLIVAFRPYRVGDYVEAGGAAGTVEEVQILTTILKTPDNKRVIVPNSQIMNGIIVNFSANSTRRVDLVFGCSYSDNLDQVHRVLREVLASEERILAEPAPTIAINQLGDSSVNFIVRPWVNSGDYWPVFFSLTEQVKRRFDAEGINIPFPQRSVHIYEHKAG